MTGATKQHVCPHAPEEIARRLATPTPSTLCPHQLCQNLHQTSAMTQLQQCSVPMPQAHMPGMQPQHHYTTCPPRPSSVQMHKHAASSLHTTRPPLSTTTSRRPPCTLTRVFWSYCTPTDPRPHRLHSRNTPQYTALRLKPPLLNSTTGLLRPLITTDPRHPTCGQPPPLHGITHQPYLAMLEIRRGWHAA